MLFQIHFFLQCLVATALAGGLGGHIGQPSSYQSPRFRWWWPGGWIEPSEIENEAISLAEAGFGGAEIGDVPQTVFHPWNAELYGFGQPRWNAAVLAAYQKAQSLGLHLDMTVGPHWPTGFPGYTPDSPETSKELVHGQVFVSAGKQFSGALPLPVAVPSGNSTNPNVTATPFLVAVIVAKTSTTNQTAEDITFDPSTVKVITNSVSNGKITWLAPSDGTYILVAVYGRGTGQLQNLYSFNPDGPQLYPTPGYVVDHFSSAGVEAGVKFWNEKLLTPQLRELLKKSQGSIFEDSLELSLTQYWTLNFIPEFKSRRGYDLTPFLLYVIQDTNSFTGDSTVGPKIANDFYQTVSDLYTGYRLEGLKNWANSIGLKLRIQPYTASFDSAYAASLLDIPEGESLAFATTPDSFRILATGRDIGGKTTILSDELGASFGDGYSFTWKKLLGIANSDMALGVSQVVIHGFPYRDSPESVWPGFSAFTPLTNSGNGDDAGFSDAWGPRQPQWIFAKNASSYLANSQKILQDSGPSIDVAIINQAWGVEATWDDPSLNDAGYSYQFPTPELLFKYNVGVKNKRLAPQGPNYKALIVNQTTMDVSTAQNLLSYGRSGLPIVVVGSSPNNTFSYSTQASDISTLGKLFSQLEGLSTTKVVSSTASVPGALSSLGVNPSVKYLPGVNNSLITYRRTVSPGNLFWVYNNGENTITETVQFEATGSPFIIDLWTGDVSPIPSFANSQGYIGFNLTLKSTASAAIYIGTTNPFNVPNLKNSLVSTNCASTYVSSGTIYLSSNISCSAITSNGKHVSLSASSLPSPITPSTWTLTVQDWSPLHPNGTALLSSQTEKTTLPSIHLSTLAAWPNITGLESASGVGTYETKVTLPNIKSSGKDGSKTRLLLDVGDVEGTYGLKINGKTVQGIDQFGSQPIDVTGYLVQGSNDLQVIVATTLWNKLRAIWPAAFGKVSPQGIGLLGPVTLNFVKDVAVQG